MLKFGKLFVISSSWSTDKSFSVPGAARGYVDPTLNFGTPSFSWSTDSSRLTCVLNGAVDIVYGKTRMIGLPYGETRGQSNLTKSASRGPIPRLGVTPGGRKLYH